MAQAYHVIIEAYVLLAVINAFLGIGTGIYQESQPTDSLRSPFTAFPLGSNFTELDTESVILEVTTPTNDTGGPIDWAVNSIANFNAVIDSVITFSQFFTAGFVLQLLDTLGFPYEWGLLVTVPFGIYTMYLVFVMITNRLSN